MNFKNSDMVNMNYLLWWFKQIYGVHVLFGVLCFSLVMNRQTYLLVCINIYINLILLRLILSSVKTLIICLSDWLLSNWSFSPTLSLIFADDNVAPTFYTLVILLNQFISVLKLNLLDRFLIKPNVGISQKLRQAWTVYGLEYSTFKNLVFMIQQLIVLAIINLKFYYYTSSWNVSTTSSLLSEESLSVESPSSFESEPWDLKVRN